MPNRKVRTHIKITQNIENEFGIEEKINDEFVFNTSTKPDTDLFSRDWIANLVTSTDKFGHDYLEYELKLTFELKRTAIKPK